MAEQQLREAYALIKQGNKKDATRIVQAVLKADSQNVAGWWMLANLLDDPTKQEKAVKRVLSLKPDHAGARKMLASLEDRPLTSTPKQKEQPLDAYEDDPWATGAKSTQELEFDFSKLDEIEAKQKISAPDSEARAVKMGGYLMGGFAVVIVLVIIGFVLVPMVRAYFDEIQIQSTAADFFEAVTDSRFAEANDLLCAEYQYSDDELEDLERRFAVLQGMSFNLDDVGLEVVEQDSNSATVRFTGEVGTTVLGNTSTMTTDDFATMSFGIDQAVLDLVREDGNWRVCDDAISLTD